MTAADTLLAPWTGPYGGVPPFDRVDVAAFEPALDTAMSANLDEIDAIATNPDAPTFENTIIALERTGRALDRVIAIYGVWSSNMSSPAFQAVERSMSPRLSEFTDRIVQNEALFARIEHVHTRLASDLDPEQARLAWHYYTNFVRAGARLGAEEKARLSQINQRLATLFTDFSQNILADESRHSLLLESEDDIAGLPEGMKASAAAAADAEGIPGKWLIRNTRSAMEPFLTYAARRDLRERAWRMWTSRGDNGDEHDNNAIATEILALRAERASLLGYETHAHWRMENSMAAEPTSALELLEEVWKPAVERVRHDVLAMQKIAADDGAAITIEPWDYRYYAERVRKAEHDIDQDAIRQYLQLDHLRDALFHVARRLLGYEFAPAADVPVYHPDVTAWSVTEEETGRHVGLWYFDPYERQGKRSGAWMSSFRSQERFDGEITTIVSNNANFVKGRPGEPVLISWEDALTLFHEFGHAVHALASSVEYPSLSGTAVPRDFVEFPSQLLEHWLPTRDVLDRFARNVHTGDPMPDDLVERMERAATFNEGFTTTEYLASALVDLRIHLAKQQPIDASAFERETLEKAGMPREIVTRHRVPHFAHIFGSDAYSAGYYSYLWADVLTADAFEAFMEGEGPWDEDVARRLRSEVLSRGNTREPAEAWRAFRGRDPSVDALLRKRGFLERAPSR